ncbi:hypothetical protein [Pantoea sp.]|uniref:hypothetical protein n=1 Tax=Pantoea sp. TaxID=69393 RepID=UPI0028AA7724|nr:hypothetical protein [Pantoea sp.]
MPINLVNAGSPILPTTSQENNQPQPVPRDIRNVETKPTSNAVAETTQMAASVPHEVTPETYVGYMNNRSTKAPTPMTFRGIKFSPYAKHDPCLYQGPLHFKNDNFIDLELYCFNISNDTSIKFHQCFFGTDKGKLNWRKVDLKNTNWEGSTIDGSYNGSRSEIKSCYFSEVNMSQCKLKNFIIFDSDTRSIYGAKFIDSVMTNMAFEGFRNYRDVNYYNIEDTSFRNMQADKLIWDVVRCVKDVDLSNAKIKYFSPLGGTEFTGAKFGIYEKGRITINPAMFDDVRKVDPYLDGVNNMEVGALFLHTLDSIPDKAVKQDFAEQMIEMIKNEPVLSAIYPSSITLRQSIINHLAHSDYDSSAEIQKFISQELLKEGNDILIPARLRPFMYYSVLHSLDDNALLRRQFLVNQLIAEYPALKERFYQITPIREFIEYIEEEKTLINGHDISHEGSLYHIFYNPDDRKTALCLPAAEFKKLVEENQVPQNFSLLQYQVDKKNSVIEKPDTVESQSRVLSAFPALHSLWSCADGLFTPVIHSLFEHNHTLDAEQNSRAFKIKNQMISMLKHKSYQTMELDITKDASVLSEILSPFYIDGASAADARWQLVELMQRELSPKITQFSEREQKTIAFMCLIKTLSDVFYTRYSSISNKPPYAPRQLAQKLVEDLKAFSPEAISEEEAALWSSLLMPESRNELPSSDKLSRRMASYSFPGEHGKEMNKVMQLYYPLS